MLSEMSFFLIGTDLEKLIITSLAHQWILCSEWVPSEWVQTADKNITIIIHTTPVHQIMLCEVKSRKFVINFSFWYIKKTF